MNVACVAVTGPSTQCLYLPVGEASCCCSRYCSCSVGVASIMSGSYPADWRSVRRFAVRRRRVRLEPSSKKKSGERGGRLQSVRYFSTGQVEVWITPMVIVQLWWKGSVFEALIRRWAEVRLIVVSELHNVV